MPGLEDWSSCRLWPADKIRLTGPAAKRAFHVFRFTFHVKPIKNQLTCIYTVYTFNVAMDVRYSFKGLLFEWDQNKARTNFEKHGVSFENACEVFTDPLLLYKETHDEDGATQAIIGETLNEHLLFVVHILKQQEVIRLISARPVTLHERREYEE